MMEICYSELGSFGVPPRNMRRQDIYNYKMIVNLDYMHNNVSVAIGFYQTEVVLE